MTRSKIRVRCERFFGTLLTVSLLALALQWNAMPSAHAAGTSYYINNQVTCNDSYAGTLQTSNGTNGPWCNVSNVNAKVFSSGDTIWLARGATWTSQTMTFTESGSAGSPITIDAYGSGARPILKGTNQATDRAIKLTDVSNWTIRNLEVSNTGSGILFYYTSKSHENITISGIYVHDNVGIVKGVPSNADNIFFSSGILFTGNGLSVGTGEYVVRNIDISDVEGTHNQDSINFDWNNGGALGGSTAPTLATQNIKLSNLYLHDDNGHVGSYQSNSCSDSLRFVGVKNATLMDSTLDNEASCYSVSGTAAVFVGITDGMKFINNVIINTPSTSSPDETGIDYEVRNDNSVVRGNYFGGNNGPGFEFLTINGTSDSSLNHAVDGNTFVGNGGGGIKSQGDGGGVVHPSGTISNNMFSGPTAFLTTGGGGTFASMTVTNTKSVSAAGDIYNAPMGFGGTQGTSPWTTVNWRYQYKPSGGAWANLPSYDSTAKLWYQNATYPWQQSASKFNLSPGPCSSCDVGKAWTAPKAGTVSIRGQVLKAVTAGGDGVKARITKNGTTIWPVSGSDQTIAYNDGSGYSTHLDGIAVASGDVIRFEVGNGGAGDDQYDTVSWAPTVAYTGSTGVTGGETFAYDWGFGSSTEGWTNGNQISQSANGGINTLTISGSDPWMYSPGSLGIDASRYKWVKIRMKNNTSGANIAEVFFTTAADGTFTQAKSTSAVTTGSDADYKEYVFDFSGVAGWTGTITQLRFDPIANATGTVQLDSVRVSDKGPSGTGLRLDVTNDSTATANRYVYKRFSDDAVTFQAGDRIEYDVKLLGNTGAAGGLDIYNSDGSYFRDQGDWSDQNGLSGHPGTDLAGYAYNQWYHRSLTVPAAMVGKTSAYWIAAGELDTASVSYGAIYDNIVVVRSGSTAATIFAGAGDNNLSANQLSSGIASSAFTTPSVP